MLRYDVPGIDAFNFTLAEALGGGGMASMRFDPLAKGMAQMLLDYPIVIPVDLEAGFGAAPQEHRATAIQHRR